MSDESKESIENIENIEEFVNKGNQNVFIYQDDESIYELNDENNTATLYHSYCICKVKRSVTFDSKEYLVNGFKEGSFHSINYNCDEIEFADDIKVSSFNKNIFRNADFLQYFNIPQYVNTLEDGWCKGLKSLKSISISPKNANFLCVNEKMIVGKSDQNKEIFDVICVSRFNFEKVTIPSNVTYICQSAFESCQNLRFIEFAENSKLRYIDIAYFKSSRKLILMIPVNMSHLVKYGR